LNGQYPTSVFYDFLASAPAIGVPPNVQAMIEQSFAKAQSSYGAMSATTKKNMEALQEVISTSHNEARTIGDKVVRNAETNAEAFFKAANALARAKTLPEFVRAQSDYVQYQMTATEAQGKELFELSTKVAQQTFESLSSMMMRGFEQLKKVS
jgi:phasin